MNHIILFIGPHARKNELHDLEIDARDVKIVGVWECSNITSGQHPLNKGKIVVFQPQFSAVEIESMSLREKSTSFHVMVVPFHS